MQRSGIPFIVLVFVILIPFVAGCTTPVTESADIDEIELLMDDAESRLFAIDWNSENPGNIRAQLSASEYQFSVAFDTLSAMNPGNEDDIRKIYALRTISCTYLELISSMRELANVMEHRNNADYYASMYEEGNWKTEMLASDSALASARNMLYSAKVRIGGINMNLVPLSMQADVVELKVRLDQMDTLMTQLADEYAKVLG